MTKEERSIYNKKYRDENKEYFKEYHKTYQKEYQKEYRSKYYQQNKAKWYQAKRRYKLRMDYGISIETYESMLKEQNECCKICETHQSKLKRRLAVDHCHTTGEVRGLLCHLCNQAIGQFKEDPEILEKAIKYLRDSLFNSKNNSVKN